MRSLCRSLGSCHKLLSVCRCSNPYRNSGYSSMVASSSHVGHMRMSTMAPLLTSLISARALNNEYVACSYAGGSSQSRTLFQPTRLGRSYCSASLYGQQFSSAAFGRAVERSHDAMSSGPSISSSRLLTSRLGRADTSCRAAICHRLSQVGVLLLGVLQPVSCRHNFDTSTIVI